MTTGRVLDLRDIGRVFVRVDPNGQPGLYLLSRSMGGSPPPIASFTTFRVVDGVAAEVGETGYANGPWYQEVHDFSEPFLADVVARDEKIIAERLARMREEIAARKQLLARFGKPKSWTSLAQGPTGGAVSGEFVVWYDPDAHEYAIEIYGPTDQLLASGSIPCSQEPRFGMDVIDHDRIFGEPGELARLIDRVEKR